MEDSMVAYRRDVAALFMAELLKNARADSVDLVPELMRMTADFAVIATDALIARLERASV